MPPDQPDEEGYPPCPTCGIKIGEYRVLKSAAELSVAIKRHHEDNPAPAIPVLAHPDYDSTFEGWERAVCTEATHD